MRLRGAVGVQRRPTICNACSLLPPPLAGAGVVNFKLSSLQLARRVPERRTVRFKRISVHAFYVLLSATDDTEGDDVCRGGHARGRRLALKGFCVTHHRLKQVAGEFGLVHADGFRV